MELVDVRSTNRLKKFLKALLLAVVATYIVFPLYLYGFTPVGSAVVEFVGQKLAGNKVATLASPSGPLGDNVVSEAQAQPEPTSTKDQPISILLLGYGGPGHDGAYLTDSMVLVIADPKTKTLTLFSIPRDTLVNLPIGDRGSLWTKINTAYAYGTDEQVYSRRSSRYKGPDGGGNLAKDAVSNVVGFPVRYYLALDFNTFRKMIDEVGGIDVTVQSAFSAQYPAADSSAVDSDWIIVRFSAGKQHMSGEKALEYARAREAIDNMAEGSDFARSRRQRQIMEEFKDKVMSPGGLIHIPALLGIAKQQIHTDIAVPSLDDLNQLLSDWRGAKFREMALTSDNYLSSDASTENGYYLSPVPGQNDWSQIHALVKVLLSNPALAEEMARTKVIVRNGSGNPEKGKELRAKLMAQGFAVAPVETVAVQPSTQIEDMTEGDADLMIESLKSALGNADIPVKQAGYPSLRVAIILGQD